MRQLTKEVYETPLTTKRVVTMESSCMAASTGKEMKEDVTMTISTSEQSDGADWELGGSWEQITTKK